jgi:hypothetical protein
MRKQARRRVANSEPSRKRGLRLSQETIRTLTNQDLSLAVSGCDTTSLTTEHTEAPPSGHAGC